MTPDESIGLRGVAGRGHNPPVPAVCVSRAGPRAYRSLLRAIGAGPPILAPPLRRPAFGGALLGAGVVLVLGVRYAGDSTAGSVDQRVRAAVDRIPAGRGGLADLVWSVGDPVSVAVIASLLAGVSLLAGRRRLATVALAGPFLTGLCTILLKPVFDRTFDGNGGLAFPSGHTAAISALTVVAMLGVAGLLRLSPRWSVILVAAGVLTVGSGTALALTAIDLHYPTDTAGGLGLALAVVLGTSLCVDCGVEWGGVPSK